MAQASKTKSVKAKNRSVVVTEAGSYLGLIDSCITQLEAQGPVRTCNEGKEEEQDTEASPPSAASTPPVASHLIG